MYIEIVYLNAGTGIEVATLFKPPFLHFLSIIDFLRNHYTNANTMAHNEAQLQWGHIIIVYLNDTPDTIE